MNRPGTEEACQWVITMKENKQMKYSVCKERNTSFKSQILEVGRKEEQFSKITLLFKLTALLLRFAYP